MFINHDKQNTLSYAHKYKTMSAASIAIKLKLKGEVMLHQRICKLSLKTIITLVLAIII